MEQNADITQTLTTITNLEDQITKLLGPTIWNYSQVLAPEEVTKTTEITNLTAQAEKLLLEYIKTTNIILDSFNIAPVEINENTSKTHSQKISEAFNEVSFIIYNLRYAKALETFADYQFIRTKTWLEIKLLKAGKLLDDPDKNITYSIYLPGSIVTNNDGTIDLMATTIQEQKTNEIKCYFSSFTAAEHYKNTLFNEIYDKSSYGMIPRMFEKEIMNLCKLVVHTILYYPVHMIYEYLKRGYTALQADDNVSHYVEDILKNQSYSLSPRFAETEKILDKIITTALDQIVQLKKDVKEAFAKELKHEVILQLYIGSLYPNNYFQLDFRNPSSSNPEESEYSHLVDFYLYNDQKLNTDFPFETYALTLTPEAMKNIYLAVSNGQKNPAYTIDDYLIYKPVNKFKNL